MGLHPALGIDTAGARAGVDAVVLLTCFVRRTVRVDHTFWSTCNIRVTQIIRDALTRGCSVPLLANSIYFMRKHFREVSRKKIVPEMV